MAIIDPETARSTFRRLKQGKELHEVSEYFLRVMTQKLQAPPYIEAGAQATKEEPGTIKIATPHGDVICVTEHVRMNAEVAARLNFSAIRRDVAGRISGREFFSIVLAADWGVEKIANTPSAGRFGPVWGGDQIIDEIIVLMLSKLQDSLAQV